MPRDMHPDKDPEEAALARCYAFLLEIANRGTSDLRNSGEEMINKEKPPSSELDGLETAQAGQPLPPLCNGIVADDSTGVKRTASPVRRKKSQFSRGKKHE